MRLTVAIPTFDRKVDLIKVVTALLKNKAHPDVNLLIIDNASPEPVHSYVNDLVSNTGWQVEIIRNNHNVGLSANLMRALEFPDSDWIWTLGDDDVPFEFSLDLILKKIEHTSSDVGLIKFSSTTAKVAENKKLNNLDDFSQYCSDAHNFNNMLFMSTSIFSKKWINKNIGVGYHWTYSLGPQFAITMAAMRDGAKVILDSNVLVVSNHPDAKNQWNKMRFLLGLSVLGEIEGCDVFINKTLSHYYLETMGGSWRWLVRIHAPCIKDHSRSVHYWRSYYMRMAGVFSFWRALYIITSAFFIPYFVAIPFVRALIAKAIGSRSSINNTERS